MRTLLLALAILASPASAVALSYPLPTEAWYPFGATSPSPPIECMNVRVDTCTRDQLTDLFMLPELTPPSDGRAYRWLWKNVGDVPRWIMLRLWPNGDAVISSSEFIGPRQIDHDVAEKFEVALAQSDFATFKSGGNGCLDQCQTQLMEAVIDQRYWFVHGDGGVQSPSVYAAGVILEEIAGVERFGPTPLP